MIYIRETSTLVRRYLYIDKTRYLIKDLSSK